MSCVCDILISLLTDDILLFDAVFFKYRGEYLVYRHVYRLSSAEKLGKTALCCFHGYLLALEEAQRAELFDRALDLSDVRSQVFREEVKDLV